MKLLNVFCLVFVFGALSMTSCKNDTAAKSEARESLASTNTTTTTTPATPAATQEAVPVGPLTSMEFETTEFDFGDIKDGDVVNHVFKFTNTGDEPLIISNAKGSCGCTVPDWPREPIAPGATSEIKVKYDSKNKGKVEGKPESKRVTITSNTDPANSFLNIKGKVFKDEEPS